MDATPRAALWLRHDQVPLARAVAQDAGFDIAAAGSAEPARAGQTAKDLDAAPAEDLRALLATTDADLIWLLDPGSFGSTREDIAAILDARGRGVCIATLEPMPAAALELSGAWDDADRGVRAVDAVRLVPLARHSKTLAALADVRESFGPVRAFSIECTGLAHIATLGAILFDAMDLAHALVGEPDLIDASYAGPRAAGGVHAHPGDTLRGLRGDLTAHLRFADGRSAGVLLSDRAGIWDRTVTLLGESGRLRLRDGGFTWHDPDGALLDEHTTHASETDDPAARAIAHQLRNLLDKSAPTPPPIDHASVLAASQAALLSARTGQSESPATIRRLAGST